MKWNFILLVNSCNFRLSVKSKSFDNCFKINNLLTYSQSFSLVFSFFLLSFCISSVSQSLQAFFPFLSSPFFPFSLNYTFFSMRKTLIKLLSVFYNESNFLQVRSAGALIKYIDKKRVGVEMDDPEVRVPILGLKVFSL